MMKQIILSGISDSFRMASFFLSQKISAISGVNEELLGAECPAQQEKERTKPDIHVLREFVYLYLIKKIGFLYIFKNSTLWNPRNQLLPSSNTPG